MKERSGDAAQAPRPWFVRAGSRSRLRARFTDMGSTARHGFHRARKSPEVSMRHEHHSPSPIELEPALRALLALLISERKENSGQPAPRTETVLARAGLSDADIAAVTGGDPADVRAMIDADQPVSVIDRARAYITRNAGSPPTASTPSSR